MSANPPIFNIQHISKSFGGVHALQDVHFEIFPGEVHALLGENDAGKSTLIKIITDVYQPDAGELFFDGQPIHFANTRAAQEHGIAAIYQSRAERGPTAGGRNCARSRSTPKS